MAMIDYGAIAFKNGKKITHGMVNDMKEMVGWEDNAQCYYKNYTTDTTEPLHLYNNYFAYVGDKDITLGFYKCKLIIVNHIKGSQYHVEEEWFNYTSYMWYKWRRHVISYDPDVTSSESSSIITVTKRNGYYVCKWKYKGDRYKVYFGYGVDDELYDKTKIIHFVNYYRLPQYIIRSNLRYFFKYKIGDFVDQMRRKRNHD